MYTTWVHNCIETKGSFLTMEEDDIECDGLGDPVVEDFSGKTFFNGLVNHASGMRVYRGESVKVHLNEADSSGDLYAYGQVTAIFTQKARGRHQGQGQGQGPLEDETEEKVELDDMLVEIRWLAKPKELSSAVCNQLKSYSISENELFESDKLDDIESGAIVEKVELLDAVDRPDSSSLIRKRKRDELHKQLSFPCR